MLMVSNIRYSSFKELDFKGRVPFWVLLLFVLLIIFVSIDPPFVLLLGFSIYILSGPVAFVRRLLRLRRKKHH